MQTAASRAATARSPSPPLRNRKAGAPIVIPAAAPAKARYPVAIFGKVPAGFALDRLNMERLNCFHRKAIAAGAVAREAESPDYDALFDAKWEIVDAAFKAKITRACDVAALLQIVVRHSVDCNDMDSVLDLEKLQAISLALVKVTQPLRPAKNLGALQRRGKLTRAGLLNRYHAFLIEELQTLSWNLYGSRDFAMQFQPADHAVSKRCNGSHGRGSKRRSYPFFDESKLTARARSVLKSLRIDTERKDVTRAKRQNGA